MRKSTLCEQVQSVNECLFLSEHECLGSDGWLYQSGAMFSDITQRNKNRFLDLSDRLVLFLNLKTTPESPDSPDPLSSSIFNLLKVQSLWLSANHSPPPPMWPGSAVSWCRAQWLSWGRSGVLSVRWRCVDGVQQSCRCSVCSAESEEEDQQSTAATEQQVRSWNKMNLNKTRVKFCFLNYECGLEETVTERGLYWTQEFLAALCGTD